MGILSMDHQVSEGPKAFLARALWLGVTGSHVRSGSEAGGEGKTPGHGWGQPSTLGAVWPQGESVLGTTSPCILSWGNISPDWATVGSWGIK